MIDATIRLLQDRSPDQITVRDPLTELATRELLARRLQLSSTAHTVLLIELDDPARLSSAHPSSSSAARRRAASYRRCGVRRR